VDLQPSLAFSLEPQHFAIVCIDTLPGGDETEFDQDALGGDEIWQCLCHHATDARVCKSELQEQPHGPEP
jgi:hypothetical protein